MVFLSLHWKPPEQKAAIYTSLEFPVHIRLLRHKLKRLQEGHPVSAADDEISVKEESKLEVRPKRKTSTKEARGPASRLVEGHENEVFDDRLDVGDENCGGDISESRSKSELQCSDEIDDEADKLAGEDALSDEQSKVSLDLRDQVAVSAMEGVLSCNVCTRSTD